MIDYGALIHDRKYFDQEHILERQARYGFTRREKLKHSFGILSCLDNCSGLWVTRWF
jgi:hypothetical protein